MLAQSKLLCIFTVSLLLFLLFPWSNQERTRKASRGKVEHIKRLMEERARREMAQNDAIALPEPPARNPQAARHHDELAVNGLDGGYLQGDLELAEWQAERLQRAIVGNEREKRKVGKEPFYKRWDKRRPIPFDFADNVPELTRHKIREALAHWQRETCLRFAEGGPDVDRLEFFDGGGCSSFVGRAMGTQGISIATPGCDFVGIIAHEVGHALGTFHEQARPDQPRHIAVHYNNIPVGRWNNFQPVSNDQAATLGLPYDPGSVMHYGAYGFASDPFRPTISTLDRHWQSTIGQRAGPSFLDIQAINEAYSCSEHCSPPLPECLHGGYPHPNDCTRCQCPNGFSGRNCQSVQPSSCGGTIQVSSTRQVLIGTPNHPTPFIPDLDCFWLLQAPPGGRVFLQFVDQFGYPCEDTCDKAFVELKTGQDFRITGYRFCCAVAPADSFRSTHSEMLVIHTARSTETSNGFKARIWSDLDWPEAEKPAGKPNWIDSEAFFGENSNQQIGSTAELRSTTATTVMTSATEMPKMITEAVTIGTEQIGTKFTEETTSASKPQITDATTLSNVLPLTAPSLLANCSSCSAWSEWSDCSQMCGGCGRRQRQRQCAPNQALCQREERRICNQMACPGGTNFLFNNGEFHLLWKGCCIGLFLRTEGNSTSPPANQMPGECGPLDSNENAFLRIISSLLSAQDGKRKTIKVNGTDTLLLARRRTGEH